MRVQSERSAGGALPSLVRFTIIALIAAVLAAAAELAGIR
jgi:hypothetical protein